MAGFSFDRALCHRYALALLLASLPGLHPLGLFGQATFTVNTTDDLDDGTCDPGHCSLREALSSAALEAEGALVAFDIPGAGPHTIRPSSPFPPLTGATILDGKTEPDYAGTPIVELDGTNAGDWAHGLDVIGAANVIRGLVVNRFSANGISIGAGAEENRVEGCYIGTDVTGTLARGNGNAGVMIGQASNNTVGGAESASRNLISGNAEGVTIVDVSATGNTVKGNYIGTNAAGDAAVPNGTGVLLLAPGNIVGGAGEGGGNVISGNLGHGISLGPPNATGNRILGNYIGVDASGKTPLGNDIGVWVDNVGDNRIGGADEGARNVISGNREGITLWESGATGNLVQGNYVGTDESGSAAIPNEMGIPVYAPGNTIGGSEAGAGNLISGNRTNGVNFHGEEATGNRVLGNLIGTDATGATALGNGDVGVAMHNRANDNTIGGTESGAGNVLSGNTLGILIGDLSVSGTLIQGNHIGTNGAGNAPIPNAQTGILVWGQNTEIGGTLPGAGNVISGNAFAGIDLGPGSTGTVIRGNYIGTNATGSVAMGNALGIFVNFSPANTIGGPEAGAGNLISGNLDQNITINGQEAAGNTILGNLIGTDATGTVALENGRGLLILDAPDNTIGGAESGAGNVISGNSRAISVEGPSATGNLLQGNLLGVDVTSSAPLGNRGAGIRFTNSASGNTVGGTGPGAGNIIANGSWVGVSVFPDAGVGNRILGNAIFDNAGMGIELNRDGVSPNDPQDADTGPNDLQNYPAITSAVANGGGAIRATLSSAPSSPFTLDFFSDTVCDETGFGEGRTPLGTASLTTDASGFGTVTAVFSGVTGTLVTATATDADGSTSEFSQCAPLSTLEVSPSPTTRTVSQGEAAVYTISVNAQGGSFEETVDLSCSGSPAGTTCGFDRDQVDLGSGEASVTMTVTTVAPAGSQPSGPGTKPPAPSSLWLLPILSVMALWASLTRRRNGLAVSHPRIGSLRRAGLVVALLLVPLSCGDDGTEPPTGGTPPGTYSLTVRATWAPVQVSTTVTLVVQ
jgi:titin